MKLLFLTSRFPYPLDRGDKLRAYYHLRALSQQHEIVLVAISDEGVSEEDRAVVASFCAEIHVLPLSKMQIALNLANSLLNGLPAHVAYFYSPALHLQIREIAEKAAPDAVFCQLIRMAPFLKGLELPVFLDYMDAFSLGMKRRAEQSGLLRQLWQREAKRLTQYEAKIFGYTHFRYIISAQDRDALAIADASLIRIAPNGVDTAYFQFSATPVPQHDVVFVGNMGYFPNVEAAKFLVQRIMPLVWEQLPQAKVLLAGARPHNEVKALADSRVSVSGFVEDIRTAYADGKLFVAPLFAGSGQQNKMLEAMSLGIPCITTTLVNNAIGATPDAEILIADTAEAFAAQIIAVLSSPQQAAAIAQQAHTFVAKTYSWEAATAPILADLANFSAQ